MALYTATALDPKNINNDVLVEYLKEYSIATKNIDRNNQKLEQSLEKIKK